MYYQFKYVLPDTYLVKTDRMSMANSIETRSPFLDFRLVDFMAKVDKNVKMQGWERKCILKRTIAKHLPHEILRAKKKGFSPPVREWFKIYFDENKGALERCKLIFGIDEIDQIIKSNRNSENDYGNLLWNLIMLEGFL
jgi:asparagine synthase (glutamine-hydrolysing)